MPVILIWLATCVDSPFDFQSKWPEAEKLYQRMEKILEKSLGRDHPNVATILNNQAAMLDKQVRAPIAIVGNTIKRPFDIRF